MNNQNAPAFSSANFPPVGRREPEQSEGDRRATGGNSCPDRTGHPDPEVVAQAKRRRFTAD